MPPECDMIKHCRSSKPCDFTNQPCLRIGTIVRSVRALTHNQPWQQRERSPQCNSTLLVAIITIKYDDDASSVLLNGRPACIEASVAGHIPQLHIGAATRVL